MIRALAVAALGVIGVVASAAAQIRPPAPVPREPFRAGSFELDAGGLWGSGIDFGSTTASITANQAGASEYPLFRTTGSFGAAPSVEARLGVRLSRLLGVEGAFQYSRPSLETRISGDIENAPPVTATNEISRYMIDASAVVYLTRFRIGRNGSPFLLGGVGYFRELDDEQTLAETGVAYHAGGGVKYLFAEPSHGFVKGVGIRGDARVYFKDGGFDLDGSDKLRNYFAGGASLILAF